jgi:phosphate transport system substrate-binding protein
MVYPITETVAEEFQVAKNSSVKVTAGISGTGGGFKKFCRRGTDISDASRPIIKQDEEY